MGSLMDTASFTISVVSLAIQVFNAVKDGYSSLRLRKGPQSSLADMVDLQVQQCRFISWAKASGLSDERLSQFGDSFMQQTMLSALCNMLQLLQDAACSNNRYGIAFENPSDLSPPIHNTVSPLDMGHIVWASSVPWHQRAQALVVSARATFSEFQKAHCKVSNRPLFDNLIKKLRKANDNLESLLPRPLQISAAEMGETTMLQSGDVGHLKRIAQATSSSWVSLAQSANFKSSYIDANTNQDTIDQAELIPRTQLVLDNPSQKYRTLATQQLDESSSRRIFVEWKRIGVLKSAASNEESNRIMLDRIKGLVVILACPADASFRSLTCLGYTTSPSSGTGLVFKLPDNAATTSPSVSLHELLKKPDPMRSLPASNGVGNAKSIKPALEDRLRLSYVLALSLYRLHRTRVIHKHIIPANIIFFPDKHIAAVSILEPFIAGFGFAREESMVNQSEIPTDQIEEEKLYWHPSWEIGKASTKA